RRDRDSAAGASDRARGHPVLPGPRHPAAHTIVGWDDPGGPRVSRFRVVDLHLSRLSAAAHLAGGEPQRRLAARLAGPHPAKRIGWVGDADPRRRRLLTAPPDAHGHLRARWARSPHRPRWRSRAGAPRT